MNRKVLLLMATLIFSSIDMWSHSLHTGAMQFPQSFKRVPSVRIYYAGNIIQTTTDHEKKQIAFDLPLHNAEDLYLLITDQRIFWDTRENTIMCLKVSPAKPYALYSLTPKMHEASSDAQQIVGWHAKPAQVDVLGCIPDNTVIIMFNADFVEPLASEHESRVTLPTIMIKNNLDAAKVERLHVMADASLLGCINSDAVHRRADRTIISHYNPKTVLIASVTT